MDPDPTDLVQAIRRGDADAFETIARVYAPRLMRFALRLGSRREDAEDLVQETLVRALPALHGFEGRSDVSTYLFRALSNLWKNRLRARSRSRVVAWFSGARRGKDGEERDFDPPDPTASALDELEALDRAAQVRRAVAALEPTRRVVLLLREVEEMSYEEIAVVTGVPVGTVRSRLSRAREDLRQLLEACPAVAAAHDRSEGVVVTHDEARLQDYLDGRLSDSERAAFEVRLRVAPELAQRVEAAQRVRVALQSGPPSELSDAFYRRARERFAGSRRLPLRVISWSAAGLAAAAVLVLALFAPDPARRNIEPSPATPSLPATTIDDAGQKPADAAPPAASQPPPVQPPRPEPAAAYRQEAAETERTDAMMKSARPSARGVAASADSIEGPSAVVPLPEALAIDVPVQVFEDPAELARWRGDVPAEALDAIGAGDARRRLVVLPRGTDCGSVEVSLGGGAWHVRTRPGPGAGCALSLPRDDRPVIADPRQTR